jgi:hypothetical protein
LNSELEFDELIYMVGDIVKVRNQPGQSSPAQIRGFYKDQFCGKYAALQWLIPADPLTNTNLNNNNMDVFDPATYTQGQSYYETVELDRLIFQKRAPMTSTRARPHDLKLVRTEPGKVEYMDGVSCPITSIDRTWFQIFY